MDSKVLSEAERKLEGVLGQIVSKSDISVRELEIMEKALCGLKHLKQVQEGGYSGRRSYDSSMDGGNSGRSYRFYDGGNSNYGGNSGGYSGHTATERVMEQMRRMMDNADEGQRQVIQRMMDAALR